MRAFAKFGGGIPIPIPIPEPDDKPAAPPPPLDPPDAVAAPDGLIGTKLPFASLASIDTSTCTGLEADAFWGFTPSDASTPDTN